MSRPALGAGARPVMPRRVRARNFIKFPSPSPLSKKFWTYTKRPLAVLRVGFFPHQGVRNWGDVMPGPRQPTDVIKANGRKHLSKAEEAQRRAGEVHVDRPKAVKVPKWVPEELKKDFRSLGRKLLEAGLYTDLDADTLGRYLIAQRQYLIAAAETDKALARKDQEGADAWGRIQERHFKQARNCANDMGLTVTSRCRLVVPATQQAGEETNPFLQLIQGGAERRA